MTESKPFSISGNTTSAISDDRITTDKLRSAGFESDDNVIFRKSGMVYNQVNGNISWNDKEIMENCRSAGQLASLLYHIAGVSIEW